MGNRDIYAVMTGDIKHSRDVEPSEWVGLLAQLLERHTQSFDIYRGDSFQAVLDIGEVIRFYFLMKAALIAIPNLSVRIGIGIGEISYQTEDVKRSNGPAFVRSGSAFDTLKKNDIQIRTPWEAYDQAANIMLDLASEITDRWTSNMAQTIVTALEYPNANQIELAKKLDKKHQSQVSTQLNRAAFFKIQKVIAYCTDELMKRC